jgi:alpha-2-macroglobulin
VTHRNRRLAAMLAALVAVTGAMAFVMAQQPAVGRLEGAVVSSRTGAPLANARIVVTPAETEDGTERRTLYAVTGGDGRFRLSQVPAGAYQVSVYLDTYTVRHEDVTVDEAQTADLRFALATTRPDLQVAGPKRLFTSRERLELPVRGFIDGSQPAGTRTLRVRVYRSRLSNLLKDATAMRALDRINDEYDPAIALSDALLNPKAAAKPQHVWTRDIRITEVGAEGFYTQRLDLGMPGVGLYLIEARYGSRTAAASLLVTDTALVVKRTPSDLVAFVADVTTGVPVGASTVTLYRQNKLLGTAAANAEGVARFTLPERLGEFHLTVVAQRGGDEAVVAGTNYSFESDGDFVMHAYTDRPIYRPGHRIQYKAIVRRKTASDMRYTVPVAEPVSIEIRDPSGEPIVRTERQTSAVGTVDDHVDLSPEAPTGTYTLVLSAAGATATHDILVAAYRKPEFSVAVSPQQPRYTNGDVATFNVSAQFFFGAPVAGATARYSVYSAPNWASWYFADAGFEEDELDLYGYYGDGRTVADGELTLDESGKGLIRVPITGQTDPDRPQDQIYTVFVTVTDNANRESTAEAAVEAAGGDFRIGIEVDGALATPGQPKTVTVVVRDYDQRPVSGVKVDVATEYEIWEGRAGYRYTPIAATQITTGADGRATLETTVPNPGYARIRATARDRGGRTVRGSSYLWVWRNGAGEIAVKPARLTLAADKRRYTAGDVARVLINTDRVGQTILLTIEGTKIHHVMTVPITERTTSVTLPIKVDYGRNLFLSALYVKDTRLATAEVTLNVLIPHVDLKVTLTADRERYQPGERATFTVQTADRAGVPVPADVSLGVVDEAIYALAKDNPKAIRDAFYPRRWNLVRTSFSYELRYLGDADKGAADIGLRRRFLDTAHWAPSVRTDASGRATVTVTLPDNLTTWRATAIAHTTDTRVGFATDTILVAKDFFVRVETPRIFSQNDQSRVLVIVHNEGASQVDATVQLRAGELAVEGTQTRTVTVAARASQQLVWPVSAKTIGAAKIQVTAWTAGAGPRLTDGVEVSIPTRPFGREEVTAVSGDVTGEAPADETLTLEASAVPGATRMTIRLTPSVINSTLGGLEFLTGYPYGCVEQTMSRFLPSVLVHRTLKAGGIPNPRLQADLPRLVRDGMTRLFRFQHESGGWGWWEHDDDHPWMTAYALYGLAVAADAGYEVREQGLEAAQKAALEQFASADPDTQVFLLYAVAASGDRDAARQRLTGLRVGRLDSSGLAYMVLLNKLLDLDPGPAFQELGRRAIAKDGMVSWDREILYEEAWSTFRWAVWDWDGRMATAAALRAILAVDPKDSRIPSIVRWMMQGRTGSYWWNTRATSWTLAALADYIEKSGGAAQLGGEIRVLVNGRPIQTIRMTPALAAAPDITLTVPASALRPGANALRVERTGGASRVYYSAELRQTVALDEIPAIDSKYVKIEREYLRIKPKRVGVDGWSLQTEPTGNELQQGDRVLVRLTITAQRDLAYILVEDPFPAGFEPTERGTAEIDQWTSWWANTDVRDDRITFFVRHLQAGRHVIEYNLRAQTPGRYNALPTALRGMYTPALRAESRGTRLVIK